mgnify:CR=1 FL=1
MSETIDLRIFATLQKFSPDTSAAFAISPGVTIREVLVQIGVPVEKAKLIFVNGLKKLGFDQFAVEDRWKFTYIRALKAKRVGDGDAEIRF